MYVLGGTDPVAPVLGDNPIVSFLVLVLTIIGGIIVLMRIDRKTLAEDNENLRKGREDDRLAIAKLERERLEANAERDKAVGENELLRSINSQQVNFSAITDLIAHHNKMIEDRWKADDAAAQANGERMDGILSTLQQIRDANAPRDS